MLLRSALIAGLFLLGGCVTNISAKAAETCRPVPDPWNAECVAKETARLQEKNRQTASILAAGLGGAASQPSQGTAFYKSNFISGMNRICVYDRLGSAEYVTIGATQICPLSHR